MTIYTNFKYLAVLRYFPRPTDQLSISQMNLQSIADILNATARKCLGVEVQT